MRPGTAAPQAASEPSAGLGTSGEGAADRPGRLLRRVTVLPTLLAAAWLLAGLPLLLAGHFTPLLTGIVATPVAVAAVAAGWRWIGGPAQGLLAARGAAPARTPWWALIALVAIAAAFGADQLAYHSQQIIINRDPASYIQFGNWIARHGSLPIPTHSAAFGGRSPLLTFASPAFYQVGDSIVPQFMAGLPMTLAPAFWLGGVSAATATGALLGACGVLVAGGLVGRLVGPRWAPLGALVLALSLPQQFTSRSTYSEPLAQLLFLGGLSLIIDSFSREGAVRSRLAALGGLALGLTLLARIDGLSDLLPLVPYCGLLLISRARQAWPLIGGIAVGAAYGAADGLILSRPYLASIKGSLLPLVAIGVLVLAVTAAAVLFGRRGGIPRLLQAGWLPGAAAAACCLVTIGLVVRPYVQTTRGPIPRSFAPTMASWQQAENLPVDVTRQYYETSIHWVFWYLGVPAVVAATIGAALLARRCLRGRAPAWTLPLMSFAWIIFTVLYRPGITPDQPWASRRLVPGVLPGIIVLALWAISRLAAWLRGRGAAPLLRGAVTTVLCAALIVPAAVTSFGIQASQPGPGLTAAGLGTQATFSGEVAAVDRLCAQIPARSSVLLGYGAGGSFAQVIRGMCGVPTAVVLNPTPARVATLVAGIRRAGRQPVMMAADPDRLAGLGGSPPVHALRLTTRGDPHTLVQPPVHPSTLQFDIWMSEFPK